MNRPKKYEDQPITPEEIEEVFGWSLTNEEAFLLERIAPKSITNSGIIIPEHIKRDRQTGSTGGVIVQVGHVAEEEMNKKLSRVGKKVAPGGMVTFSYAAPVDIGLLDENGMPMLSGFSESPYAGLC